MDLLKTFSIVYEQWRKIEGEKGPKDFILWLEKAEGCAPIIDKEETVLRLDEIFKEKGYANTSVARSHILEFHDYSWKERTIQVDIIKSTFQSEENQ